MVGVRHRRHPCNSRASQSQRLAAEECPLTRQGWSLARGQEDSPGVAETQHWTTLPTQSVRQDAPRRRILPLAPGVRTRGGGRAPSGERAEAADRTVRARPCPTPEEGADWPRRGEGPLRAGRGCDYGNASCTPRRPASRSARRPESPVSRSRLDASDPEDVGLGFFIHRISDCGPDRLTDGQGGFPPVGPRRPASHVRRPSTT